MTRRDEVTGEWRRLHNEEALCSVLLTKYHSDDQIKKT